MRGLLVAALAALSLAACGPDRARGGAELSPLPTRPAPSGTAVPDGRSSPVADPVYPAHGNPAVDVLHYDLALEWAPATRTLTGTATLAVRIARDTDAISLDFATYALDKVTLDGAPVVARYDSGHLIAPAGRRLPAGTAVTLVVGYHGTPSAVAFPGVRPDVQDLGARVLPDGALWSLQEPYGAFTWYPVNDQPSDEAPYDVAITVPTGWAGVSSGTLAGIRDTGGKRTYLWRAAEPVASYAVAFAVDRYAERTATGPHGLPITYWVRPADEDAVTPWLFRTPQVIDWLEKRFGPYPFGSAGVVIIQGTSGMETQTMVTLAPLRGSSAPITLAHEFAHHWFGNAVTPRTWADMWLNEGFALYAAELLYTVDQQGGDATRILADWRARDGRLRAEHGPPGAYKPDHFAAPNVYHCAALMLDAIRHKVGDPTFFAMLHDWVQHHLHTTQDRASFTTWLNTYTAQDLTALVNRWLDSPTTPDA